MTIAWPSAVVPNAFMLRLKTNQRTSASPFGGSEQTIDMQQDRWVASMSLPPTTRASRAAAIETFLNAMRGQTQVCYLHHFSRPVPLGTMRGIPSCTFTPQGAAAISIGTGGPGATLKAGDMIGAGGLLLQVAADAVADGSGFFLLVPLVNRTRKAIPNNTPVIWDRPTAPFRMVSPVGVQHLPGYAEGVSLDFVEAVDL